jgi:tRNA threonylcarbamoyl adenosine modification protein YeaZ
MPLLQEMLDNTGTDWRDLTALGVGIGPGNFTGIRIAVSAARGLALGLDVPAVGVSGCEARAYLSPKDTCPAIPAPRDMVYLCRPNATPQLLPLQEAQTSASTQGLTLNSEYSPQGLAEAIAHIAATRWATTTQPPAPLYVRPVDAAPSRHVPPVMLD